ncbi:hypothetical protein MMC30_000654 [Trapelia coarctata]|nr:hypothetical protein [Trapelia coarctata]
MSSSYLNDFSPEELNALTNVSAAPPPSGTTSNFTNPENNDRVFNIISSLLLGIMIVVFMIRMYTKTFVVRKYSWDDFTIVAAVICSVAYYVAAMWGMEYLQILQLVRLLADLNIMAKGVHKGVDGIHQWDVNIPQITSPNFLVPSNLIITLSPVTMLFVKITFFIMYFELFRPMRWLRICVYIGSGFTTIFYAGLAITMLAVSIPGPGEILLHKMAGHSSQITLAVAIPQAAVGLAIDIYILVVPIIAVSQLKLRPRQKLYVSLIIMTGLLACVASMLSIYYRKVLEDTILENTDNTWPVPTVNTTNLGEMFIGIICASMPALANACRHFPPFVALKGLLHSRLRSWSSSTAVSKDHPYLDSKTTYGHREPGHTPPYDQYTNLDSLDLTGQEARQPEMAHMKSSCAFVPGEERDMVNEGIYLSIDLEQNSRQVPGAHQGGQESV